VIGQNLSHQFVSSCVIGINRADAKSTETPHCYGNRLVYRLKFYPAPNRSRNIT